MTSAEVYIAGYRIERVIGAGGMGTVYLAQNPTLPRYDALKVLSAQLSTDQEFRVRFWREADVASRLDHPNIVSIYRRGETATGQLWIAMQFVNGTDADEVLRAGRMTSQRAVYIVAEVAKALDYAHSQRVVHRDIKPANILLSNQSVVERVFLSDFGIARALDDVGLTATGSVMATVDYAAPEVLSGKPIDHRADVYSLGCTLFRMITGKTPYPPTGGMASAMIAHLEQPPPRISAVVPALPPALDQVIYRVLAKDPSKRYQSAGEFAAATASALRGDRAGGAAHRATMPVAHWTSYVDSSAQAADRPRDRSSAGAQTMSAPGSASQLRRYSAPPDSPPARRKRGVVIAIVSALVLVAAATVATAVVKYTSGGEHSTAVSTPSAGPIPLRSDTLRDLLLSRDDLNTIMGVQLQPDPVSLGLDASSDILAEKEKECAGPWGPGLVAAYTGSGWLGAADQGMRDGTSARVEGTQLLLPVTVLEAVVNFQSAGRAAAFFATQKQVWARCSNRSLTIQKPGELPDHLSLGVSAVGADDTLTITNRYEGGMDNKCTHLLGVRNNVSIDVEACSRGDTEEQAAAVYHKIAARIPIK